MADNVDITPGSGVSVAADDISSVLYQRVKISHGADGSATDVSTTSPLPTRRVGASLVATPTTTVGAYSAKDAVGGVMTFTGAVRATGGKAIVRSLVLTDLTVTANVLQLWLFDTVPASPIADNGAFDVPDNEFATIVGIIPIAAADYLVATDNQVATVRSVNLQYTVPATTLYGQLMCTGTPTYASTTDLTLTLEVEYLD